MADSFFHVRIFEVVKEFMVDVSSDDSTSAMRFALAKVKSGDLRANRSTLNRLVFCWPAGPGAPKSFFTICEENPMLRRETDGNSGKMGPSETADDRAEEGGGGEAGDRPDMGG